MSHLEFLLPQRSGARGGGWIMDYGFMAVAAAQWSVDPVMVGHAQHCMCTLAGVGESNSLFFRVSEFVAID